MEMADRKTTKRSGSARAGTEQVAGNRKGGQVEKSVKQVNWGRVWFGKLARFHRVADPWKWTFSRENVIEFLKN
jgi:hypothetical protein